MTVSESPVDGDFDRASFETDLAALITRARTADIDPRGAYDVRTAEDGTGDYTVEISAVKRPSSE